MGNGISTPAAPAHAPPSFAATMPLPAPTLSVVPGPSAPPTATKFIRTLCGVGCVTGTAPIIMSPFD
jgi:hypothetical protein